MNCKKCGSQFVREVEVEGGTGGSCMMCGQWHEPEVEIYFKFDAKESAEPSVTPISKPSRADTIVWANREVITLLIADGDNDVSIAERYCETKRPTKGRPATSCGFRAALRRFRRGRLHATFELNE